MANYKRKGPKTTRAGCLFCKPHKRQGTPRKDRQRHSQTMLLEMAEDQIKGSLVKRGNM